LTTTTGAREAAERPAEERALSLVGDIDRAVLAVITAPANRWPLADQVLAAIDGSTLLAGGLYVAVLCWLWAEALQRGPESQRRVVRMVIALVAALAIGRAAQLLVPYRPRPLADPRLAIAWPPNPDADQLSNWSSMPSDHALYFMALATAFWFRARWLGLAIGAWSLLTGLLPRIYFGQHYPSDVVVGSAIGIAVAIAAMTMPLPARLLDAPAALARRFPAPFYALAMLVALETATMFFETRAWLHRAGLAFYALRDTPAHVVPAASVALPADWPERREAARPTPPQPLP
jgi:undecaprenyl-diphosphatase